MAQVVTTPPAPAPKCYFKNTTDIDTLNSAIATKANASDVASSLSDVSSSLSLKANVIDVNASLDLKPNTVDVTASLNLKQDASVAAARVVAEKTLFDAIQAALFIPGADGITEYDWSLL